LHTHKANILTKYSGLGGTGLFEVNIRLFGCKDMVKEVLDCQVPENMHLGGGEEGTFWGSLHGNNTLGY
jgi:hypothetical protein